MKCSHTCLTFRWFSFFWRVCVFSFIFVSGETLVWLTNDWLFCLPSLLTRARADAFPPFHASSVQALSPWDNKCTNDMGLPHKQHRSHTTSRVARYPTDGRRYDSCTIWFAGAKAVRWKKNNSGEGLLSLRQHLQKEEDFHAIRWENVLFQHATSRLIGTAKNTATQSSWCTAHTYFSHLYERKNK